MEKNQLQTRCLAPVGMQVREGEGSRTIEGCAIVFNQETTLWDGKYTRVREMILPSCCAQEFLREQDVKLNLMHNRNETVCRNNKGEGTLQLELRADGLYFKAEMPKCDLGDRALELVRNKTLTGCSFEFWPKDWTEVNETLEDGKEDTLIIHSAFESLTALTIALDPAYEQTSVEAREAYEARERECQKKKEEDDCECADDNEGKDVQEAECGEDDKNTRERDLAVLQSDIDADYALLDRGSL